MAEGDKYDCKCGSCSFMWIAEDTEPTECPECGSTKIGTAKE